MNITQKTTYHLEIDQEQLKVIKEALSDSASRWATWASSKENEDLKEGGWANYRKVANVLNQFNKHYEELIKEKNS